MKIKLQLLILLMGWLLIAPSLKANNLFSNLDPATEKKYWDYLSERLIDPGTRVVSRFQNDQINVYLSDATQNDSIIVINLLNELQKLIPKKKVQFTQNNESRIHADIRLFYPIRDSLGKPTDQSRWISDHIEIKFSDSLGNRIKYNGIEGAYDPEISTQRYQLVFNDSMSLEQRKQYSEYCILRSLCAFNGTSDSYTVNNENGIYNKKAFDPTNTQFTEADKFLINKLYSPDFEKQYKRYIIKHYSWKTYYEPYLDAITREIPYKVVALIVGLILLFALYKPVFNRKYRNKYLSYLLPAIAILFIVIIVINIIGISEMQKTGNSLEIIWLGSLRWFFIIMVLTHFLFLIEVVLIKRMSIKKQNLVKVLSLPLTIILFQTINMSRSNFDIGYIAIIRHLFFVSITIALIRALWLYIKNINQLQIQEKEVEISHLKELKAKAELQSLHSRINPHFLYNSLNTIAGLANTDAQKTEQMALALSDLFRYTINRNGDQLTTIDEEVKMATTYLEVEKIRFGNRMSFKVSVEENLLLHPIPKFILQPLIENAIKHGVSQIKGNGEVSLNIKEANNEIRIEVKDNGPDFANGLISGYGLQSIFDILKLTYADSAGINWRNTPDKAITLNIPLQKNIPK